MKTLALAAILTLGLFTRSEDEKVRVRALPVALEYTFGRPPIALDVTPHPPPPAGQDQEPGILTLSWHLPSLPIPLLWVIRALIPTSRQTRAQAARAR
jgi:hypothetical protein